MKDRYERLDDPCGGKTRRTVGVPVLLVLAFLGFALCPGLTGTRVAGAIEIRVDAETVLSHLSPLVFGNSLIHTGDCLGYNKWVADQRAYDEAKRTWNYYLPYLRELGPTVIRYPGGLAANNFAWKPGIGPMAERDPDFTEKGVPQTFGTDEFLQYCEEIGAEAILVVNVSVSGTRRGSVQDAADWVEYCNAPNDGSNRGGGVDWAARRAANGHVAPYGVTYWELGNEDTYPGWDSYADRVNAYSAGMKAIDPDIQVGAIRTGGGLDALYQRADWLRYHTLMLEKAGTSFDFWSHHAHGPAVTGQVKGFAMCAEGASVTGSFTVAREGDYALEVFTEGTCKSGVCPRLVAKVDGTSRGDWRPTGVPVRLPSAAFHLLAGVHTLRLESTSMGQGRRLAVFPQVDVRQAGGGIVSRADLRDSREWYHALLGYGPVAEEAYQAAASYTGGKPVFYTELNTVYQDEVSPPYLSQAAALREMLSTGCLYHFLLTNGVPLSTYWLLFQDRSGVGVLEGVSSDPESGELGRLTPHRRPVFHLLKAYRGNVLDWLVDTEITGAPRFPVGPQTGVYIGYAQKDFTVSTLQVLATISAAGDRLSLFVINLDPEEDHEVPVVLQGFPLKLKSRVQTITGASPGTTNEPEDCPAGNCVGTTARDLWLPGASFPYTFPRHSVTVFLFYRQGSDQNPPAVPGDLRGAAGDGVVRLNWNRVGATDLKGYNVYGSRCPEGPYLHRVNSTPISGTGTLVRGADNGVMQTYAVTAVDSAGNESGLSGKVSLTPFPGGGVPAGPVPGGGGDVTPPSPPLLVEAE